MKHSALIISILITLGASNLSGQGIQDGSSFLAGMNGKDGTFFHASPSMVTITVPRINGLEIGPYAGGYFTYSLYTENGSRTYIIADDKGEKTGEITKMMFAPRFNNGHVATAGLLTGHSKLRYAIIDTRGEIIKEFEKAQYISDCFIDGYAKVTFVHEGTLKDTLMVRYINEEGEFVHQDLWSSGIGISPSCEIRPISEGRRAFLDNSTGLYGFLDENWNIVIPARYDAVHEFSENLAAVMLYGDSNEKLWGFIDKDGNMVIEPRFQNEPDDFHEGFTIVQKQNYRYVYIDKSGTVRSPEYTDASRFFHGEAFAWEKRIASGTASIIDRTFSEIGKASKVFSRTTVNYKNINYLEDYDIIEKTSALFNRKGEQIAGYSYWGKERYGNIVPYSWQKERGYMTVDGKILVRFIESEF